MTDTNPLAEVIARLEAHVAEGIENCECVMAPDLPAILAALKAGAEYVEALSIPQPSWADPQFADKSEARKRRLSDTYRALLAITRTRR